MSARAEREPLGEKREAMKRINARAHKGTVGVCTLQHISTLGEK